MTVKISYKNNPSNIKPRNLIFFVDEKFRVSELKKYFTKKETNFIVEVLKSQNLSKKIISFDLSSTKKIFLISVKKDINISQIENLGAKFLNYLQDVKNKEFKIYSDVVPIKLKNFVGYFLHGLKLKSYIFDKYNPEKNSKAFSYFSVITKNWFIQKVKKNTKRLQREVRCDDVYHQVENEQFVTKNRYEDDRAHREFWTALCGEIDGWKQMPLKETEQRTILAIEDLIANIENIEIFNKKAIYLYLREISGLNTKQLVASLSNIKKRYREFKYDWVNGDPR